MRSKFFFFFFLSFISNFWKHLFLLNLKLSNIWSIFILHSKKKKKRKKEKRKLSLSARHDICIYENKIHQFQIFLLHLPFYTAVRFLYYPLIDRAESSSLLYRCALNIKTDSLSVPRSDLHLGTYRDLLKCSKFLF